MAYGDRSRDEAVVSIGILRERNDLPVAVISNEPLAGTRHIEWHGPGKGARWAKLNLNNLTPWDYTLYLDADTRPRVDVSVGFDILDDGWDMVMVTSASQGRDLLWHIGEEERTTTFDEWGHLPLQLQAGVFWLKKNERTQRLFGAWRTEWRRWADQDQAAFLRALRRCPVKMWFLGRPWNGGALIQHLFGRARDKK